VKLTTDKIKEALAALTSEDLVHLDPFDEASNYNGTPASDWKRVKKVKDGAGRTVRSFVIAGEDYPAIVVTDTRDEKILGIWTDSTGQFIEDPEDVVALRDEDQPWRPPTKPSDYVFIFAPTDTAIGPMVYVTPKGLFDREKIVVDQSWANGFLEVCDDGMNSRPIQGLYEETESTYSWDMNGEIDESWLGFKPTVTLRTERDVRLHLSAMGLEERQRPKVWGQHDE